MSKPCRQTCPLPPPRAVIAEECFGQWNGPTGLEITEEMLLPALLAGSLVSNYFTLRSRVFPARVVIKMTQCNNITKCKVLDKYFRSITFLNVFWVNIWYLVAKQIYFSITSRVDDWKTFNTLRYGCPLSRGLLNSQFKLSFFFSKGKQISIIPESLGLTAVFPLNSN